MALSIMTLSKKDLYVTLSITMVCLMLRVVMLDIFMLIVVVPID
jgi:hypothetical protein